MLLYYAQQMLQMGESTGEELVKMKAGKTC